MRRQVDFLAVAAHDAGLRKYLEIPELELHEPRFARTGPAQQRSDTSGELLGFERLGDVVVSAGFEAGHNVVGIGTSRDHDDRHCARLSQLATVLEPVDSRQHYVDHEQVERIRDKCA